MQLSVNLYLTKSNSLFLIHEQKASPFSWYKYWTQVSFMNFNFLSLHQKTLYFYKSNSVLNNSSIFSQTEHTWTSMSMFLWSEIMPVLNRDLTNDQWPTVLSREEESSFQHILLVHVPDTVCHIIGLVFSSSSVWVTTKYSHKPWHFFLHI